MLERLPFVQGYGVDMGLLIDLSQRFGVSGLVQVDLDVRHHRNRSLADLSPQALAIVQTMLRRVDPTLVPAIAQLVRPGLDDVTVDVAERPPMIEVDSYARRRGQLSIAADS